MAPKCSYSIETCYSIQRRIALAVLRNELHSIQIYNRIIMIVKNPNPNAETAINLLLLREITIEDLWEYKIALEPTS
jgi:hypothetical protein